MNATNSLTNKINVCVAEKIDIRIIGSLEVRRADGTDVDSREWRTGKTSDLLRLLALRVDHSVSTDTLVSTLWPSVERARALASLRTAASQIRHVLSPGCIDRSPAGLQLRGARVDVQEFRTLTATVRQLLGRRDHRSALSTAMEADGLYRGDFTAHNHFAEWAVAERGALADDRLVLLGDAAQAAIGCQEFRLAQDYARRIVDTDPFSELGCRLLMLARAGLGETSYAIREYQRCRELLADEFGVDPSPQTSDLYLRLLRGEESISA
ncbi:MAG: hypothetical protein JWR06_2867 [Jatrophihabitans sp.]|nr:hypothetical protein [Jatrophihabitans sp.]MCW2658674.1 hypothetical protein [Jatrophihabitans sp.]